MFASMLGAAALYLTASARVGTIGECDPVDGPPLVWTEEARAETRARVQAVCKDRGASKAVCAWLDASVIRESSGRPGVRHVLGEHEHGVGALGLSVRWMGHHWPGNDEDPAFCQPEASALVSLAVARRAFERFGAVDLVSVQSIFGGHWRCYDEPGEPRRCFATKLVNEHLCSSLAARGVDCMAPLTRKDFGRWTPVAERRELAARLASDFTRSLPIADDHGSS